MMIYMLAIAMTVTMLVATAFGLHQELHRLRVKATRKGVDIFGNRSRRI